MRHLLPAIAVSTLLALIPVAHATTLTGSAVSGSIVPDQISPVVTQQFTSPITIGSGSGFTGTLQDNFFSQTFTIDVTFTANSLIISIPSAAFPSSNLTSSANLFDLTFTDTAFAGSIFPLLSYGCDTNPNDLCPHFVSGLTAGTLSGNTLDLAFNNIAAGQIYTFTQSTTPEPSTFALLGSGLLGIATTLRKRRA